MLVLEEAARASLYAPPVFNTQPWIWRITGDTLELSALLLLATADGLATAPLSDAVEVAWPRHLLRGLLADIGEPYLVIRLGYVTSREPLPPAPRRDPGDVIFTR